MFPYTHLPLLDVTVSTAVLIVMACFFFGWGVFWLTAKHFLPFWKLSLFYVVSVFAGLAGGRLFHVFWERREYFMQHPSEIFTRLDGLTFYGSVISGYLMILFLNRIMVERKHRPEIWDCAAILVAFGYGFIRIGCFANGCCWGRLCTMPWAVSYFDPHSLMPYLGVPVHPVQLYDAFGGIAVGVTLLTLKLKRRWEGYLAPLFFILYGLVRFFTEFYRGDFLRRANVLFGLSTSQLISVILIFAAMSYLLIRTRIWRTSYA